VLLGTPREAELFLRSAVRDAAREQKGHAER
jgi:hypothetical protein